MYITLFPFYPDCGGGQMNKPTLIVLAAGLGSRYGGLKQIDAVGRHDETLLDYSTYDAVRSGFGKVLYIIRKDIETDFRERLFDRIALHCDASYVFQTQTSLLDAEQIRKSAGRTKPWGTVHALLCASDAVHGPFAVINADDYYGRSAYATLSAHLSQATPGSGAHAMVGYMLRNTMSESGSVSRAVCTVRDGYLEAMREHTKIRFEGTKIMTTVDGIDSELSGNEWVSMNFFGFMPEALENFGAYFQDFIEKNVASEKAESFLPEGASSIVKSGKGTIKFYTSEEKWFGMTYPEDRIIVKNEIAKKIDSAYYPENLWKPKRV